MPERRKAILSRMHDGPRHQTHRRADSFAIPKTRWMYAAQTYHRPVQATTEEDRKYGHDGSESWTHDEPQPLDEEGSEEANRHEGVQQLLRREHN